MKYSFVAIIYLIFFHLNGNSQTYWIPKKAFYEFLYTSSGTFPHVHFNFEEPFLPISKKNNVRIFGGIAKNKNGLFFTVYGTGQVYKATAIRGKEMAITRIDSTIFWGNTFASYDFSYNDTLYSFGGYGFWKNNGQLRYFIEGGEWQIAKLNQEHVLNSLYCHIDTKTGKLYYVQVPFESETDEKEVNIFSVFQLDLTNKQNKFLGEINLPFDIKNCKWHLNSISLNGIITYSDDGHWYLLQPNENKVYKLTQKRVIDFLNGSARYRFDALFDIGDRIYRYSNEEDSVRSIAISLNDFEIQQSSMYRPHKNTQYVLFYIFSGISILLMVLAFYVLKKRNKKRNYPKIEENHIAEIENSLDTIGFTELEKFIIDNMLTKSKANITMNVDDLNRILGVGKKTVEIQKKTRREILNRINNKYKKLYSQDTDLIESIRSDHDKRYFNYLINPENIKIVERDSK